ncbi:MAG: hypothetical protein GY754_03530 [bacterium]|nr:hypothetical protein [bacterium]
MQKKKVIRIFKGIFNFIKNIIKFFPDYKSAPLLRLFAVLTTYLSILIWTLPLLKFAIVPSYHAYIDTFCGKTGLLILTFLIMFNNFVFYIVNDDQLKSENDYNLDSISKILRNNLELLSNYYSWQSGYRITLFIPKKINDSELIMAIDRISYGNRPGMNKKLYFKKGQGMPGKAWDTAWDGENYNGFIDAVQISHIPKNSLKKGKLEQYFDKNFNIDGILFGNMSEQKFEIHSYLSVGIIGKYNQLAALLVVDSCDEESFTDFEILKHLNRGIITGQELNLKQAVIAKESNDLDSKKTKRKNGSLSVPKQQKGQLLLDHDIENLLAKASDPKLKQEEKLEILGLVQLELSKFEKPFELDSFIILFSLILKNIRRTIIENPELESYYE